MGKPVSAAALAGTLAALVATAPAATARRAHCLAGMVSIDGEYCIDRYEASVDIVNARGKTLRHHSPYETTKDDERLAARSRRGVVPQAYLSQEQAEAACENAGKRLCTDQEWIKACKGKHPSTYPYGDDHVDKRCNDDGVSPLRILHGGDDSLSTFGIEAMNDPRLNKIKGSLARTGHFRRCRSSYGTYDMVGNLHEWTSNSTGVFRGGYYLDDHLHGDGCNYLTTGHNTHYHDYSIGFRCCRGGAGDDEVKKAPHAAAKKHGKARTYVIEKGDTLGHIANKFDTSVAALCDANDIKKSAPIRVGQELKIP